MRVSVVGAGYLGATHAATMAELGHEVVGIDIDEARVSRLQVGEIPFYEPGLSALLTKHVSTGALRFSTSLAEAGEFADVHFVCVGTPQKVGEYQADLTAVDAAFTTLATHLRPGAVVVGKSTVPAGTAARLAPIIEAAGGELVWNPEFLREGLAVQNSLRPDRIVLGIGGPTGLAMMKQVYLKIVAAGSPVLVTDYATAELVKVAANSFLATKISFINAMAEVCDATGADIVELAEAIGHDERIGPRFLNAGLGFGGGCLPKDIRAFMARAAELHVDQAVALLKSVDHINLRQRARSVDLARAACDGTFVGKRVAVLGVAFKPDTDDIRDSPAVDVALAIHRGGAEVCVYDPQAMTNAKNDYPQLVYAPSAIEACRGADVVLHATQWEEFREIAPADLAAVVRHRRIVDGRNTLDDGRWRAAGWTVWAPGRRGRRVTLARAGTGRVPHG
jgi:UDPglucose 6-dehydrogenase